MRSVSQFGVAHTIDAAVAERARLGRSFLAVTLELGVDPHIGVGMPLAVRKRK